MRLPVTVKPWLDPITPQFRLDNSFIYNSPLLYSPALFSFANLNGIREYVSLLNTVRRSSILPEDCGQEWRGLVLTKTLQPEALRDRPNAICVDWLLLPLSSSSFHATWLTQPAIHWLNPKALKHAPSYSSRRGNQPKATCLRRLPRQSF